jgi:hypothetical protein
VQGGIERCETPPVYIDSWRGVGGLDRTHPFSPDTPYQQNLQRHFLPLLIVA